MKVGKDSCMVVVGDGTGRNMLILHRKPPEMEIVESRSEEAGSPSHISAGSANAEHGTE